MGDLLPTSIAAEISTNTRKMQYMTYFIRRGFTMSGGISSLSNATYIIPEEVQVEKKGPVKATTVAGEEEEE